MSLGNKLLIVGAIVAIPFLGFWFGGSFTASVNIDQQANVPVITDGSQLLSLTAKGGYFPAVITARADMPSTLRISTSGTFDCSSAFTIPKLGIRKMLPASGATDIAIPAQVAGTSILGTCSMGMYNFTITYQ